MKFIFAIIVLGLAFIFGLIHPGMEVLAAVGSLSPALVALVFYTIKTLLKCRAGDNTASVQFSDICVWGILGAIIMFFYNLIGLFIFDRESWNQIHNKIFITILIGGLLVYWVCGILTFFFYSRNIANEKRISFFSGILCTIGLIIDEYKKVKKDHSSFNDFDDENDQI